MDFSEYDYELPKELIAQKPLSKRDHSRLMVLRGETILHSRFEDLGKYLESEDVIVLNDSRVYNAKVVGKKKTGGRVEILVLNSSGDESRCLIRGKKIREGTRLEIGSHIDCEVLEKDNGFYSLSFSEDVDRVIDRYGEVPLPYYIKESLIDSERYQTVYSKRMGSVAAPTAGLHFTDELMEELKRKGVKIAYITLHIGPSTFLPLRNTENPPAKEFFSIDKYNADLINTGIRKNKLIPVGTSTVKALESAAVDGRISPGEGWSSIFISPGYRFKVPVKGMITNFHLPRSSLLLLVSTVFGRERILSAYEEAKSMEYRFYSFGDSMFIEK